MSVPDSFPSYDHGKPSEGSGSQHPRGSFHQHHQSQGKGSAVPETVSGQSTRPAQEMPDDINMSVNSEPSRLVNVVNSSIAVGFLQGQLQYFQDRGFDVTVLCPEHRKGEWEVDQPEGVPIIDVPMEREIAPLRDFVSLWRLWRIMRTLRPTVTNVGTPKAGLLGGFAAWLNRVPCRFYTLHGLRFETTRGLRRRLLIHAERLACCFAHRVVCVSQSVREKAIAFGLTSPDRTVIFGSGSCNGVDVSRFAATPDRMMRAAGLRCQFRIPAQAPVVLFCWASNL